MDKFEPEANVDECIWSVESDALSGKVTSLKRHASPNGQSTCRYLRVTNMEDKLGLDFALIHRKHKIVIGNERSPKAKASLVAVLPIGLRCQSPDFRSMQLSSSQLKSIDPDDPVPREPSYEDSMELLEGNVKGKSSLWTTLSTQELLSRSLPSYLFEDAGVTKIFGSLLMVRRAISRHPFQTELHVATSWHTRPSLFTDRSIPYLMTLPNEHPVMTNRLPQLQTTV